VRIHIQLIEHDSLSAGSQFLSWLSHAKRMALCVAFGYESVRLKEDYSFFGFDSSSRPNALSNTADLTRCRTGNAGKPNDFAKLETMFALFSFPLQA
jgi:hypothetical protein